MEHLKRLPECQEKFDAMTEAIDGKASRNGGWVKHLPIGVVIMLILGICSYVDAAIREAAQERDILRERYDGAVIKQMDQNKNIEIKLESISQNIKFIKSQLKLKTDTE